MATVRVRMQEETSTARSGGVRFGPGTNPGARRDPRGRLARHSHGRRAGADMRLARASSDRADLLALAGSAEVGVGGWWRRVRGWVCGWTELLAFAGASEVVLPWPGLAGGQNSSPSQVPPKSVLPPGAGFVVGAWVPGWVPAGGFGAPCEGAAGLDAGASAGCDAGASVAVVGEDGRVLSVVASSLPHPAANRASAMPTAAASVRIRRIPFDRKRVAWHRRRTDMDVNRPDRPADGFGTHRAGREAPGGDHRRRRPTLVIQRLEQVVEPTREVVLSQLVAMVQREPFNTAPADIGLWDADRVPAALPRSPDTFRGPVRSAAGLAGLSGTILRGADRPARNRP